jgi:acetyl/propionyl-CoA carboxylase alpha subunit
MSWLSVGVRGKSLRVAIVRSDRGAWVSWGGTVHHVTPESASATVHAPQEREIRAPMTGRVVRVSTAAGAAVRARETLVVIEAMKMEYRLTAPREGVVETVSCAEGDRVDLGSVLVTLAP